MRILIMGGVRCGHTLFGAQLPGGVAKIDLEPPLGTPMAGAGYGGLPTLAKALTIQEIEARVLALSDGSRTVALVS